MPLTFDEKLLIEQVRAIEQAGYTGYKPTPNNNTTKDFEQQLRQRAHSIVTQANLRQPFKHGAIVARRLHCAALVAATITGALAAVQTMDSFGNGHTINVYWLIVLLLGVNCVSLLLWLAAMLFYRRSDTNNILATVWRWLERRFGGRDPIQAAANNTWFTICHHSQAGRWWLSGLSHSLWLAYLLAGLLVLLLLLITRQFDFVWATTLLSDQVFVQLTQFLSTPLQWLGVTAPDLEQIQLSRQGMQTQASSPLRQTWALFLLGAVFMYGVLPRLVLLLLCKFLEFNCHRQFQLDLNQPYYIRLFHELMPNAGDSKIVDPDELGATRSQSTKSYRHAKPVPTAARWLAVELGSKTPWPIPQAKHNLGHVIDSATLSAATDSLNNSATGTALVVAVALNRAPDRGIKRILTQLFASTHQAQRWLVLIDNEQGNDKHNAPCYDAWRSVASECAIPEHQLSIMQPVNHDEQ